MCKRTNRSWLVAWGSVLMAIAFAACVADNGGDGDDGDDDPDPNPGPVTCGNHVCDAGETTQSCPADCGQMMAVCGNHVCDAGETAQSCAADCGPTAVCGNHSCEAGETAQTCPADCGPTATCGNAVCEAGETSATCLSDCGAKLQVVNHSSYTVLFLRFAQCGSTTWGSDQLGTHVIGPSQTFTLAGIPPQCWRLRGEGTSSALWESPLAGYQFREASTLTWTLNN